ncbi:MAG: ubiquinol-cytochrome C chaperone family protein [Pseudomonadota bacterium]
MAQTRLPIYYQGLGVPDTLEGRFAVLALNLFAVLHRLKGAGDEAAPTAQGLADRFASDMETVLREIGTSDLKVPKKVRKLVSQGASVIGGYEQAFAQGRDALSQQIVQSLPLDEPQALAASARLTPYILDTIETLDQQPLGLIYQGEIDFPAIERE